MLTYSQCLLKGLTSFFFSTGATMSIQLTEMSLDDARVVPSLTQGWVHTSTEKIDLLLSAWLLSDYSQSEIFHGHIVSLPYMIVKLGHNPEQFVNYVSEKLSAYIGRYYDNVVVDVTYEYIEANSVGGPYGVKIEISGTSNGERVNLAKGLEITDSKLVKIMNISNGV